MRQLSLVSSSVRRCVLFVGCALLAIASAFSSSSIANAQDNSLVAQLAKKNLTVDQMVEMLKDKDVEKIGFAAASLFEKPDAFARTAKPLAKLFLHRDEVLQDIVKRGFREMGVVAVEALSPNFDGSLEELRLACSAIEAIGDPAAKYKPQLVEVLKSTKEENRRMAAMFALKGFSDGCVDAIPHILDDLKHSDMNMTLFACRVIIKTGPDAKKAIPNLVALLSDGVISQRSFAGMALASIGPTDEFDVEAAIKKQLDKFHVVERERALIALGMLGESCKEMEPKVREMMALKYSNLEGPAAVTLWQITGKPEDSVKELVKLSRDMVEYELTGLRLLEKMGPAAEGALEFAAERARHPDPSVRMAAIDIMAAVGEASVSQQALLEELVKDIDPSIRMAARAALKTTQVEGEN